MSRLHARCVSGFRLGFSTRYAAIIRGPFRASSPSGSIFATLV